MAVITDSTGVNFQDVDATGHALIKTDLSSDINVFFEVDDGLMTQDGLKVSRSPKVDFTSKLKTSNDTVLDSDVFTYAAQNTGRHRVGAATQTNSYTATGLILNNSGILTANTGVVFSTYAPFPVIHNTFIEADIYAGFDALQNSSKVEEFGLGLISATGTTAPTDGLFFRLDSNGMNCVASFNTTEIFINIANKFQHVPNRVYKFEIVASKFKADFYIDNKLYCTLNKAENNVALFQSNSMLLFFQSRIAGTVATSVLKAKYASYSVSLSGSNQLISFNDTGNMNSGSYQGLSGQVQGSLAIFPNNTNPTPAVPTNTSVTLGNGLGGQFIETDTLAITTDGIISSFQVPVLSNLNSSKRLIISSIKIDSFVQTALTGGGYNAVWSLAFGHTAVSLANTEGAASKAPRRIALGNQPVAAGAVALTDLKMISQTFTKTIIVNPGEFIQVVKKKVGVAPTAGAIFHSITVDYSWV